WLLGLVRQAVRANRVPILRNSRSDLDAVLALLQRNGVLAALGVLLWADAFALPKRLTARVGFQATLGSPKSPGHVPCRLGGAVCNLLPGGPVSELSDAIHRDPATSARAGFS